MLYIFILLILTGCSGTIQEVKYECKLSPSIYIEWEASLVVEGTLTTKCYF